MQIKGECIRIIKEKGHVEQNLYLKCEKGKKITIVEQRCLGKALELMIRKDRNIEILYFFAYNLRSLN